jgi:AcrR family transcriptional regulator
MDMLASQLGISKRTIYEVFRDKDELLQGVFKWMKEKQAETMKKIFSDSENVIVAIFKMLDMMGNHFQNMSPAFQMDMKRYHHEIFRKPGEQVEFPYSSSNSEIIKRGIKEGIFRKDIDVDITNKCMLAVAKMSNDKTVFPPDDYMSKDVVRTFYLNYLRGISTQKGLDLINLHDKKLK